MTRISDLQKDDIISFMYGSHRIKARVLSNDGASIIWTALSWRRECIECFDYNLLRIRGMIHVGKYRPLWKRLLTLNFHAIEE